jgi:hypothetical protein
LTPSELAVAGALTEQTDEIIDLISHIVAIESPSGDLQGSHAVVRQLRERDRALSSVSSIEVIASPITVNIF